MSLIILESSSALWTYRNVAKACTLQENLDILDPFSWQFTSQKPHKQPIRPLNNPSLFALLEMTISFQKPWMINQTTKYLIICHLWEIFRFLSTLSKCYIPFRLSQLGCYLFLLQDPLLLHLSLAPNMYTFPMLGHICIFFEKNAVKLVIAPSIVEVFFHTAYLRTVSTSPLHPILQQCVKLVKTRCFNNKL